MNPNEKSGQKKFTETVDCRVEKLVSNGLGLVRMNGEAILTAGALTGERLKISVSAPSKGVRRGQIVEVLEASPVRIQPDCPLAGRCGGCDFIHVRPEAALKLKAQATLGELAETWGLTLSLLESPYQARYRSRATLHLALAADGKPGLGFYDGRRALIEFDDCLLIDAKLMKLIATLRQWAKSLPPEAAAGAEFSLTLGAADSGAFVAINPPPAVFKNGRKTEAPNIPDALMKALPGLSALLAEIFPRVGLFVRPAFRAPLRPLSQAAPGRLPAMLWPELGLQISVGPGEFTQVNPLLNKLMVSRIVELAAPLAPGRALDLYSGHGNIALPLARSGFAVIAVEDSPEGARSAAINAGGLMEVKKGRSEKVVEQLKRCGEKFSLIVLDPPRAGARDLAPHLAALNPEMIVYAACHPAALARDLPAFISLGYHPQSLTALDMFPRTSHMESLMALRR